MGVIFTVKKTKRRKRYFIRISERPQYFHVYFLLTFFRSLGSGLRVMGYSQVQTIFVYTVFPINVSVNLVALYLLWKRRYLISILIIL